MTPKVCTQTTLASKIETGGWKSVKMAKATFTNMTSNKTQLQKGVSSIQKVILVLAPFLLSSYPHQLQKRHSFIQNALEHFILQTAC